MTRWNKKPKVIVRCVANHYASDNERIVEIASRKGRSGALISILLKDDDTLRVDIYRRERCNVTVGADETR